MRRMALFLFLLAGLFGASFPRPPAARAATPLPVASVTAVLHSGMLLRAGSRHLVAATTFTPLFTGDRLRTPHGQRTAILLRDGAQFLLNQDTDLGIAYPILRLYRGEVFARIPHTGTFHVVVRTDAAVAAVQGTAFDIQAGVPGARANTVLTVAQGSVLLSNSKGSVLVSAGQQATANPNTAPSQPITVPVGAITAWTARVHVITTIALPPHYPTPRAATSAARAARARLAGHPGDAQARLALADALADQGQAAAAQAQYRHALALLPPAATADRARAAVGIAATAFALGDLAATDTAAAAALALDPANLSAGLLRGDVAVARGDVAGALADARALQARYPTNPRPLVAVGLALLLQRHDGQAAAAFRAALALRPPGWLAASALFDLAALAEAGGNLAAAQSDDQQAVLADPRDATSWINLGSVLGLRGAYREALRALAIAARLGDAFARATALDNMGEAYYELGALPAELAAYRAALTLNPSDAAAANGVGTSDLALGNTAAAVIYTRLAVTLAPRLSDLSADYARALWAAREYARAEAVCVAALRADPTNPALYMVLGFALEDAGNLQAARVAYARAYDLRPPNAGSAEDAALAGQLAFYAGHVAEAIADLQRATALHAANYQAWELLALVEERAHQYQAGIAAAARAVALNPSDIVSHQVLALCDEALGDDTHAAAEDHTILRLDPHEPGFHADLGLIAQRHGDLATARDEFLAEIRVQSEPANRGPRLAAALATDWGELGVIYDALHDPSQAIDAYGHAITYDPKHGPYYLVLGLDQEALGQYPQALASFTTGIGLDPSDPFAYFDRGFLEVRRGRLGDAERDLRHAVLLAPRDGPSRLLLGTVLLQEGKYAEARDQLRIGVTLVKGLPVESGAWDALGSAEDHLGDYAGAADAYRHALAVAPRLTPLHSALGLDLFRLGQYAAARAQFALVRAAAPRDPFVYLDLALADEALGHTSTALAELRAQIGINQGSPALLMVDYRILGLILVKHQRWPEAVAAFARVIALGSQADQDYYDLGYAQERNDDPMHAIVNLKRAYDLASAADDVTVANAACKELAKFDVRCP